MPFVANGRAVQDASAAGRETAGLGVPVGSAAVPSDEFSKRRQTKEMEESLMLFENAKLPYVSSGGGCLTETRVSCCSEGFAAMMRGESFVFWLLLVVGGFCSPSRKPAAIALYKVFWLMSFLVCGGTCFANVFFRYPPYHLLPADLAVAMIHVPALFSIFFWRQALADTHSPLWRMLGYVQASHYRMRPASPASSRPDEEEGGDGSDSDAGEGSAWDKLCSIARLLGRVMLPVLVFMVGLVYIGFAFPASEYGMYHASFPYNFATLHACSMWIVIPPVVCCILANGAFFAFFVAAHTQEANIVAGELLGSSGMEHRHLRLTDRERYRHLPEDDRESNALMSEMIELFLDVQDRLDRSCIVWSRLVVSYLLVAFVCCLVVAYDCCLVILGQQRYQLSWSIVCVDLFLFASSMSTLAGYLFMGAKLTGRMDELCMDTVNAMLGRGVPVSMAASSYFFLEKGGRTSGIGFKILNARVDKSHVLAFGSALFTMLGLMIANSQFVSATE